MNTLELNYRAESAKVVVEQAILRKLADYYMSKLQFTKAHELLEQVVHLHEVLEVMQQEYQLQVILDELEQQHNVEQEIGFATYANCNEPEYWLDLPF
ncbi:hypothetical protein [Adhaeribacter aquaticus]|uniref:hypothetical protein n=1 Tax=Adhaeribacter aquaticus TaxID=299567 RepID=UPI0003FDAD5A|nr:hypothetical protein [Adhaeribacter aquaticus]